MQYFSDEPAAEIGNSISFKSKIRITGKTPANGNKKNVEIKVPLKEIK